MLKFYNTLTRKLEVFKPIEKGKVKMYNCGPTVYNYAHIGNFRAYVCSDLLRRYLEFSGYKVKQVMNLTDVDDKTIRDSQKEGKSLKKFTEFYNKAFFEDIDTLNILRAHVFPKATEHINEMVAIIKKCEKSGHTYTKDGSVYFKISSFKGYGKLAGMKFDANELKSGARVKQDDYTKDDAHDFALWKGYDKEDGDVFWETEYGKGRPGWHIECSAMSTKHLGEQFDIHTGGIDLIFPHHTNEIAQSEGASGEKFVNYWLHNEWMFVEGQKMSKRLGNFFTLRDVLDKGHSAKAVRYLLLSTNYRQKLNFTFAGLDGAQNALDKLFEFVDKLGMVVKAKQKGEDVDVKKVEKRFSKEMDNDLNVSGALGAIFDFIRDVNKLMLEQKLGSVGAKKCLDVMKKFDQVLGVLEREKEDIGKGVEKLIALREEARSAKDYAKADKIRDDLRDKGIELEDTPMGVKWKKVS
jgi:cysteinyl-tRNA synthetase